jgi:dihydroorotase
LNDSCLKEDGKFKMNPPIRSEKDRLALIEGVLDGTIDMIATDHAPHSAEEKSRGLEKSAFGIVGIETAFQLLYTHLVKKGVISLEKVIDLLAINPRKRFSIPFDGFSVWKLDEQVTINPEEFLSKGKSTPFAGEKVFGKNYLTVACNKIAYKA